MIGLIFYSLLADLLTKLCVLSKHSSTLMNTEKSARLDGSPVLIRYSICVIDLLQLELTVSLFLQIIPDPIEKKHYFEKVIKDEV